MFKRIKTLVLLLFLGSVALVTRAATMGQIVGRVIDEATNQPVAHATIIFENSMDRIEVLANENAWFYADHVPTGRYSMTIIYAGHNFVMKKVRVYDSYASELDFYVSSAANLPDVVLVPKVEPLISAIRPTDITLANNDGRLQPTQQLSDVLAAQPGVDVKNGVLYVKGSSAVKFFIDGTPVMGPAVLTRGW